jgi:hypothetical protein
LNDPELARAERRIVQFTVGCVLLATVAGLAHWGWRTGVGVLAGGVLSLVNLYWVRRLADALVRRATDPEDSHRKPDVRAGTVRALMQFALLAAVFYAIFISHFLPIGAVLTGFFAAVGGIILEAFRESIEALRGHSSA